MARVDQAHANLVDEYASILGHSFEEIGIKKTYVRSFTKGALAKLSKYGKP